MNKHTKGPWVVDLDREFIQDGDTVSVEAVTEDGKFVRREVCSLMLDTGANKDGDDWEEDAANARLIAKAPDHKDIAWALLNGARWECWGGHGLRPASYAGLSSGEFCFNGMRYATKLDEFGIPEVNGIIRAVITKARGDTP